MKVLVLGAGGMAGHVIATYLSEKNHDVNTLSAHNKFNDQTVLIDVTDQERLREYLDQNSFDIVVNCIGLLVKQSEQRNDLAVFLNSYLPHFLENYYKDTTTRIIHLSTDCVFSGKNAPYREDSTYDGELFYDRSKALGEIINGKDLTFRMSIIGPDMQQSGVGLFNWFYAQTGQLNGYKNVIWNGITTIELAKSIDEAIDSNLTGLYQLVPQTNISKYDLLNLFVKTFDRQDITVNPETSTVSDKTLINTRTDFSHTIPTYEVMVAEMHDWVKNHQELYGHYK
jgi:dTDP-4-dehydrorhamnose reductase